MKQKVKKWRKSTKPKVGFWKDKIDKLYTLTKKKGENTQITKIRNGSGDITIWSSQNENDWQGEVAHTYNPNTLGGQGRQITWG